MDQNCTFCQIIVCNEDRKKGVQSYTSCFPVDESPNFLAFLNVNPIAEGDVLIIPKIHKPTIWDLPDSFTREYADMCKRIANKFRRINRSNQVYQLVGEHTTESKRSELKAHAHIHLIPLIPLTSSRNSFRDELLNLLIKWQRNYPNDSINAVQKKYKLP